MGKTERPWWYPKLVDAAYLARLREDYPEDAHLNDDDLRAKYECEEKYAALWDDLGDAYDEYEKVADRMLELEAEVARLRNGELVVKACIEFDLIQPLPAHIMEPVRRWQEAADAAEAEELTG